MKVYYVTTDALNEELAAQAAEACGADFDVMPPRAIRAPGPFEGMLYDLDHLWSELRSAILDELLSRRLPWPTAVHSYALHDGQLAALRARGVIASRRLVPEIFQQLCRLTGPAGESEEAPDGDDPAALCAQVRSVASSAHRLLTRGDDRPAADPPVAMAEVREQLDQLQRQLGRLQRLHHLKLEELQRWASNLRRLIDEHS